MFLPMSQYNAGFGGNVFARNIPINPNLIAGPGTARAAQIRQRMQTQGQGWSSAGGVSNLNTSGQVGPRNYSRNLRPTPPGANQKTKAMNYYFQGQNSGAGTHSTFSIDPGISLATGNIQSIVQQYGMANMNRQSNNLPGVNAPPNFYQGFGNQIKFAGKGARGKQLAKQYTEMRNFGMLGSISRDTATGQMSAFLKATAADRAQRAAMERAASIPKEHWQPESQGQYNLGNMQGQRERAWYRREAQRQDELNKKKLQVAGPGEKVQHEAKKVERATTR